MVPGRQPDILVILILPGDHRAPGSFQAASRGPIQPQAQASLRTTTGIHNAIYDQFGCQVMEGLIRIQLEGKLYKIVPGCIFLILYSPGHSTGIGKWCELAYGINRSTLRCRAAVLPGAVASAAALE